MPTDSIFQLWLDEQQRDVDTLNAASDIVKVVTVDRQHYVAEFDCRGLIKTDAGEITETGPFVVGFVFADDYLRHFEPWKTICLFHPNGVFHPNVMRAGICPGHMTPGTSLSDLISQCHSILTYQHMNLRDPWNREAANWARDQKHRFPIDRRPLRRRRLDFGIEEVTQ